MHVYYITGVKDPHYVATLGEARETVRETSKERCEDVCVILYDLLIDKDNVLRLLNCSGGTHDEPLRFWKAGPRGGLVEITAEQYENEFGYGTTR